MGAACEGNVGDEGAVDPSMESYNRLLMEQINEQLKRGFGASLQARNYCVVGTGIDGILLVMASTAAGEPHDVVFGPKPFAACVEYVNASFVKLPPGDRAP